MLDLRWAKIIMQSFCVNKNNAIWETWSCLFYKVQLLTLNYHNIAHHNCAKKKLIKTEILPFLLSYSVSLPSEIFSPESAGSTKISRVMEESSMQGMRRFRAQQSVRLRMVTTNVTSGYGSLQQSQKTSFLVPGTPEQIDAENKSELLRHKVKKEAQNHQQMRKEECPVLAENLIQKFNSDILSFSHVIQLSIIAAGISDRDGMNIMRTRQIDLTKSIIILVPQIRSQRVNFKQAPVLIYLCSLQQK